MAAFTYWMAWPDNHAPADYFSTKREAAEYVRRNGGGGIRKFRERTPGVTETRMDTITIEGETR